MIRDLLRGRMIEVIKAVHNKETCEEDVEIRKGQ
jgi:hypothetical protein